MVDADLNVWLLEVNSSPSMDSKGQPILQHLVRSLLGDLAKVVIDWQEKRISETGGFILAHKAKNEAQTKSKVGTVLDLTLEG